MGNKLKQTTIAKPMKPQLEKVLGNTIVQQESGTSQHKQV